MIQTHQLTRFFGDVHAVDGVSIDVPAGEIFGCLGHNGAGKTTLVRLLNGVLRPTSGTARVMGKEPEVDGAAIRRRTGVLTETPSLYPAMTGRQTLRFFGRMWDMEGSLLEGRVEDLLLQLGLDQRGDDRVDTYSRGMRQRLALARALLHEPSLLFLDEPTSTLDPVAALDVRQQIRDYLQVEGRAVFLCTHDLAEAQALCHRVAILQQGRVLVVDNPEALIDRFHTEVQVRIQLGPAQAAAAEEIISRQDTPWQRGEDSEAHPGDEGADLTVVCEQRESIPELVRQLVEAGLDIHQVIPVRPTLEDVYLGLHGRSGGESGGGSERT